LLLLQRKESDAAAEMLERRRSDLELRRDKLSQQVKSNQLQMSKLFVWVK